MTPDAPLANADNAAESPENVEMSTPVLIPGMDPRSVNCQKVQLVQPPMSGVLGAEPPL